MHHVSIYKIFKLWKFLVFVVNPVAQPVSWVNPKKRSTHSVNLKKVNLVVNPKKGQPIRSTQKKVNPKNVQPFRSTQE